MGRVRSLECAPSLDLAPGTTVDTTLELTQRIEILKQFTACVETPKQRAHAGGRAGRFRDLAELVESHEEEFLEESRAAVKEKARAGGATRRKLCHALRCGQATARALGAASSSSSSATVPARPSLPPALQKRLSAGELCCPDGHVMREFFPDTDGWCCQECGDDLEPGHPHLQCMECDGLCWCAGCTAHS